MGILGHFCHSIFKTSFAANNHGTITSLGLALITNILFFYHFICCNGVYIHWFLISSQNCLQGMAITWEPFISLILFVLTFLVSIILSVSCLFVWLPKTLFSRHGVQIGGHNIYIHIWPCIFHMPCFPWQTMLQICTLFTQLKDVLYCCPVWHTCLVSGYFMMWLQLGTNLVIWILRFLYLVWGVCPKGNWTF